MLLAHDAPLIRVKILESEHLSIRSVAQNDRAPLLLEWPVYVGPDNDSVIHFDRHIPIDTHAVSNFTDCAI